MGDVVTDPAVEASGWGSERVDVDAYLRRIGYGGELAVTDEVLRRLHRAHAGTIPFENLDIVLGRPIDLDIARLQDKMVRRARGGYCYEHNLLFAAVLERLGFTVTRYVGRIRMGSDRVRPRSHMTLRVDVDGRGWLADVGFGGEGLLEPITFDDDEPAAQDSWVYRLHPLGGGVRVLQSRHGDTWFDLYSFAPEPQHLVDYESYNWYTSTHPRSPFTRGMVVQRTGGTVRHTLTRSVLTTVHAGGATDRRRLDDDEVLDTLGHTFGIVLDAGEIDGLRAALAASGRPGVR